MFLGDDHAGSLQFLASRLDLSRRYVLVLVDAHSDSSAPRDVDGLRRGLRQVASSTEREERIRAWRRTGAVQSFDWIAPLMPEPISKVVWVRPEGAGPSADAGLASPLPAGFVRARGDELSRLAAEVPVVASIDLDAFSGLPPETQAVRFSEVWTRVVGLPGLRAITFAISRPWLSSDEDASRLAELALRASLALAHATVCFEPWGVSGPDRSERAKAFYGKRREPPRFDPESASSELRSLLLASAGQLEIRDDPARWRDLLARWRAEGSPWRVAVEGVDPDADGVHRLRGDAAPALRIEGGPPGRIARVTWLRWVPSSWAYDVLPELPAGKVFAGTAPPVVAYESSVIARTESPVLAPEVWMAALPGPARSGVLRISAELETAGGREHTARIEVRRGTGSGFRAGLSEQFGLPYVFGAGFLRAKGLRGPDTGVGNDCANFLVSAWRRSGLRIPWSNPDQLRRRLSPVATGVRASDRAPIPLDAEARGLVIHLGSHVAALWEDRPPLGTLGPEDVLVHHLGGPPSLVTLAELLRGRERPTFDLYLGPSRAPAAWIAVGGDVMPGEEGAPPETLRTRLRQATLAVANLETTVGSRGNPARKRYTFRIPEARLADVRSLGIAAVSLANNHAGDFGTDGLLATLGGLERQGIGHFGAGSDTSSAVAPWFARVGNVVVAFISVSLADQDLLPASGSDAGIAALPRHEGEIAQAISTARNKAQTIIVFPHWGDEGSTHVTDEQQRWARWFVEQGADAVIGSGPHVIQGYEAVAGVPIFYSVGNLWFHGTWPSEMRVPGIAFLGVDPAGRIVATRLEQIEDLRPSPKGVQRQAAMSSAVVH